MKIAIPSMDDRGLQSEISYHFGQTPYFTLVDLDGDQVVAAANPGHAGGRTPAQFVAEAGAEVVICDGMGQRAIQMLAEQGIQVFMGAKGTVGETLAAYKCGELPPASEDAACAEHH